MTTVFCSFYTPSGVYPALASKLRKSLDSFGLSYDIIQVDTDFQDWESATCFKPQFILSMLKKHRDTVIWLDIDTEVWKYPSLLFQSHDFAIYNWFADTGHHLDGRINYDPDSRMLLCSGGCKKNSAIRLHVCICSSCG